MFYPRSKQNRYARAARFLNNETLPPAHSCVLSFIMAA